MTIRFLIVCGGSGVNLLGQRRVLGADAELQIDVSKENVVRKWRGRDPRSFSVDLDRSVGTTGLMFQEALGRIREEVLPEDKGGSEYVQWGIYREPDVRHTKFMVEHFPVALALEWGLAQSPAAGGATIRHSSNRHALRQVFKRMTAGLGLGQENPLKVWIVASTAGGAGEGVHRFVAAYLAHFLSTQPGGENTPIFLNFIRIGQLTYRSVNPERTALNTFFGVAADAAFALKVKEDFPQVTTNWFYVDVPDVGVGARSVPVRAEIVEMAAKAIMLEELQDDLQRLLVNNAGIPMVLVRTGYWGKDFGEQQKYYETLRQLRTKLRGLVEPDYERKYLAEGERHPPRFEGGEELDEWVARVQRCRLHVHWGGLRGESVAWVQDGGRYVLERVEGGWQFPRYRMREFPRNLEAVGELVGRWKRAMEGLLNRDWGELKAEFLVERVRQVEREERREMVPLRVSVEMGEGEERFGREEWFERVEGAHEASAWARHLLGCDLREGVPRRERRGLIEGLLRQAEEISGILHGFNPFMGSQGRARRAAGALGEFLRTLVQVDLLVGLERDARRLLDRELVGARQVLRMVEQEFDAVRGAIWEERKEFIEPNYEQKYIAGYEEDIPQFVVNEVLGRWGDQGRDAEYVLRRLEEGWRFPRHRVRFPRSLADLRRLVSDWKKSIEKLLDVNWEELQSKFLAKIVVSVDGEERQETRPLSVPALVGEKDKWFERIEIAHYVRAWVWYLLGCDLQDGAPKREEGKLIGELLARGRGISKVLYGFPPLSDRQKKAERVSGLLEEFIGILAQVNHLLSLEEEATYLIERELQAARGDIEGEQANAVITAALSDALDPATQMTWLQLLRNAARRGERDLFREEVLRGATGLTEMGLRELLDLRSQADVTEIHDELASHMGRMYDSDGRAHEAPWWAGTRARGVLQYEYRILPRVSHNLRSELEAEARAQTRQYCYVFTPRGALGLRVLVFQGISLAREMGDTVTAPTFLLKPFTRHIRKALAKWADKPVQGASPGELAIVSAGVCGEPLYERAMRAAGLDDEDFEKIQEYYRLQ